MRAARLLATLECGHVYQCPFGAGFNAKHSDILTAIKVVCLRTGKRLTVFRLPHFDARSAPLATH
jgi:hypothetical protein